MLEGLLNILPDTVLYPQWPDCVDKEAQMRSVTD